MPSSSNFVIPGDIKQKNLPFTLNGSNIQKFSFRPGDKIFNGAKLTDDDRKNGANGFLNICPSSYFQHFNDDIASKLLYSSREVLANKPLNDKFSFENIFNMLPGIQIREFLPHTKLDQAINFISPIYKKFKEFFSSGKDFFEKLDLEEIKKRICSIPSYLEEKISGYTCKSDLINQNVLKTEKKGFLYDFPFTVYYQLQTTTTTNYFVIPGITSTRDLYSASGSAGWLDGNSSISFMPDFIKNVPIVGSIVNKLVGNVGIDYMPWWNPDSGAQTKEPEIKVEFDLFNDTLQAALINFIFVNTIIPGNRWIQYGIFKHSSNLYDVKLEGYNRLFACCGDFSVSYKGILRTPPQEFYSQLKANFSNDKINKPLEEMDFKIPDVYHVTMIFRSLLPANFNNYMFNIASKLTVEVENSTQKSQVDKVQTIIKDVADKIFTKSAFETELDVHKNNLKEAQQRKDEYLKGKDINKLTDKQKEDLSLIDQEIGYAQEQIDDTIKNKDKFL